MYTSIKKIGRWRMCINSTYFEFGLPFFIDYLGEVDRNNLRQVNKRIKNRIESLEANILQVIKERIRENEDIYIRDEKGIKNERSLSYLGEGGSKRAFKLESGLALLLPSFQASFLRWKKISKEEVSISQFLTKIGMLSPLSFHVNLAISPTSLFTFPTYASESFENLGLTKKWFIIDWKNEESSTWKEGKNSLFTSEEDRRNLENWNSVVDPLLTDLAKIYLYDIPADGDSLNVAIVKKDSNASIIQYEIRYFGFDFTNTEYNIPKNIGDFCKKPNINKIYSILNLVLDSVVRTEYTFDKYEIGPYSSNNRLLKYQLLEKYKGNLETKILEYRQEVNK